MSVPVSVEARVLGQRSGTGIPVVDVELPSARMRVADLVRVTVEEQVRTLTARRLLTAAEIEQQLARQYGSLTPDGGRQKPRISVPQVDIEQEVQRALAACRSGQCLVIIDRQPVADLDQEIEIATETEIKFLRLLPLAGG